MPQRRNYPFYQIVLMCGLALTPKDNALQHVHRLFESPGTIETTNVTITCVCHWITLSRNRALIRR